jgi:hypothetical protein
VNKHSKIRPIVGLTQKDITRFMAKISINPNGCHEWTGGTNKANGSGIFCFNNSSWPAHRVAFCLENGNPTANLIIIHKCKNPRCVNTDHLFTVSKSESFIVGDNGANQGRKITCPRGHTLFGKNLIDTPTRVGRACKPCDNASRMARRRNLIGEDRENYILQESAQIINGRGFRQVA